MRYEGIIFDLDGVICFTDNYHYLAWKALAEELGIAFDRTKNDRLRGVSRMESLEIILEDYHGPVLSAEQKQEMAGKKNDLYRQYLQTMTPADLSEAVKGTLLALRERGLKLAIGSSSKNAPLILERIGLAGFFDAVSDGNNIQHSKPDPQVFLMAADMLKLPPEKCLVVEDADAGIEAAVRVGFPSAASGAAALTGRADYCMENFETLLEIV